MQVDHKYYGIYRGLVVNNKDPKKMGKIVIWVPDIMPEVSPSEGLWARPANNPIGGRNSEYGSESHYAGTSYIPRKGAYVFVFFESGNLTNPCYFGALDLENTKVLAENQTGDNYEDKWTILKSPSGRCIHISDDPGDERVEITGKKRQISNPPSGDISSVFAIDGNQTTILLDERAGQEKLLIRTYKGDFINIDIENQNLDIKFKNDIKIECGGNYSLTVGGDYSQNIGGSKSSKINSGEDKLVQDHYILIVQGALVISGG